MKTKNTITLLLVALMLSVFSVGCNKEAVDFYEIPLLKEKMPEIHKLVDFNSFQVHEFVRADATEETPFQMKTYEVIRNGEIIGYYSELNGRSLFTEFTQDAIYQTDMESEVRLVISRVFDESGTKLVPDFQNYSMEIVDNNDPEKGWCEFFCNAAYGACVTACGLGTGIIALGDTPFPGPADAAAVALFAACIQACDIARVRCVGGC